MYKRIFIYLVLVIGLGFVNKINPTIGQLLIGVLIVAVSVQLFMPKKEQLSQEKFLLRIIDKVTLLLFSLSVCAYALALLFFIIRFMWGVEENIFIDIISPSVLLFVSISYYIIITKKILLTTSNRCVSNIEKSKISLTFLLFLVLILNCLLSILR